MRKTTKVIVGSALTMAMCATLITGATLALFTSEDAVNLAVSSGKVNITATAGELKTYVPNRDGGSIQRDEAGAIVYKETTKVGEFDEVGGSASIEDGTITLTNFAPMDKVTFNINVKNDSTLNIKYQYKVEVTTGFELFSALEIKVDNALTVQGTTLSDWTTLEAGATGDKSLPVEIVFPEDAGEESEGLNCKVSVSVMAVQANADTKDPENEPDVAYAVRTPADLAVLAQRVNRGNDYAGETVKVYEDVDLTNIRNAENKLYPWTPIGTEECPFNGSFDGNGKTITGARHVSRTEFIDNVGLFGYTGAKRGGEIKNFTYKIAGNALSVYGSNYGYIVGNANYTTISGITISNKDGGSANISAMYFKNSEYLRVYPTMENIGMIAGYSKGEIIDCHVDTDGFMITGEPYHEGWDDTSKGEQDHNMINVGGIVGKSEGSVSNCSVIGISLGGWDSRPGVGTLYTAVGGGIVGYLEASGGRESFGISSCYVEYHAAQSSNQNMKYLSGRSIDGGASHIGGIVGWVAGLTGNELQADYETNRLMLKIEKNFFKAEGIKENANPIIGANDIAGSPKLVEGNFSDNGWKITQDSPANQEVKDTSGASLSTPLTLESATAFAGVTDYVSFLEALKTLGD